MLKNGVYVLVKDVNLSNDLKFNKGQELEVVGNVVYMGGYPLPFNLQNKIITWMGENLTSFKMDNRNF